MCSFLAFRPILAVIVGATLGLSALPGLGEAWIASDYFASAPGDDDRLLKSPDGRSPGVALPELTTPFVGPDDAEQEDEPLPGATSVWTVTPRWTYLNLDRGFTRNGGDIQVDLHLALDDVWLTHVGADASFIDGGTLAGFTWDVGKLADTSRDGFFERSVIGAAVDVLHVEEIGPDQLTLSQIRGVWGYAVSDVADVGVVGMWPLDGDNSLVDPFGTTVLQFDFTRQVQIYLARTIGDWETVWYVGHRAGPDAAVFGLDVAGALYSDTALVSGVMADDQGAVTCYVGLQVGRGFDRFAPSRLRGYHHRLTRGGPFSTILPSSALPALGVSQL